MTTQSSGIAELTARIARLETLVRTARRVGTVVDRDLEKMLFDVQAVDGQQETLTGVRLLYMRMAGQKLETLYRQGAVCFAIPTIGETVVLERLGLGWVVAGSYGHDIEPEAWRRSPPVATWDELGDISVEMVGQGSAVQLYSWGGNSDGVVYVGFSDPYFGVAMASRGYADNIGTQMQLHQFGIEIVALERSGDADFAAVGEGSRVAVEDALEGENTGGSSMVSTGPGGSHSNGAGGTVGNHQHYMEHTHTLAIRFTPRLVVREPT